MISFFSRFKSHFRFPVSLPQDIAIALGLKLPKISSLSQLLDHLLQANIKEIYINMPRDEAEKRFASALQKEIFQRVSLFSYFFPEGWLVFALHFDEKGGLVQFEVQPPAVFQHNFVINID